jgi:hypothetical protein
VQHDHLPAAPGGLDHGLHRLHEGSRPERDRADQGGAGRLGQYHDEVANATLISKTDSWYVGSNVPGKQRRMLSYAGGAGTYHQKCEEVAIRGYPGFVMS